MAPDTELVLLLGGLHLVALVFAGLLFWMFMRSETVTPWEPPEDEEGGGGGGNDRRREPPTPPKPGGIPLPDAEQSSERFRGPGRLADRHRHVRRPAHAPTPQRTPARIGR